MPTAPDVASTSPTTATSPEQTHAYTRVVTVRMPASLHRQVRQRAYEQAQKTGEDVSMNRLCIVAIEEFLAKGRP